MITKKQSAAIADMIAAAIDNARAYARVDGIAEELLEAEFASQFGARAKHFEQKTSERARALNERELEEQRRAAVAAESRRRLELEAATTVGDDERDVVVRVQAKTVVPGVVVSQNMPAGVKVADLVPDLERDPSAAAYGEVPAPSVATIRAQLDAAEVDRAARAQAVRVPSRWVVRVYGDAERDDRESVKTEILNLLADADGASRSEIARAAEEALSPAKYAANVTFGGDHIVEIILRAV